MIGNLADIYLVVGRYVEAQVLLKRVINSGLVPADTYRLGLAEAYYFSKNYHESGEVLVPLFYKDVFDAVAEEKSQPTGISFREAVFQLMIKVSYYYWLQAHKFEKKGDDLAFKHNRPGMSACITDTISNPFQFLITLMYMISRGGPRTVLAGRSDLSQVAKHTTR